MKLSLNARTFLPFVFMAIAFFFLQEKESDINSVTANQKRSLASTQSTVETQNKGSSSKKATTEKKVIQSPSTQNKKSSYFSQTKKQLEELDRCYQSEDCDFPKTDPKSYYFAVGQALKKRLMAMNQKILEKGIKSPLVAELAQKYLKNPDGHVKEAALHLLSSQDISKKSLQALLQDIIHSHDAKLIQHAMLELQRYLGGPQEAFIHQQLAQAIQTGAPAVSKEITKRIGAFITKDSLEVYSQVLVRINPSSMTYNQLKTSIEEFKKKQTAA